MAIKNTSKMIAAFAIINENPRFEGINLTGTETTNDMVCDLMHSAGYSWDRKNKVWYPSTRRKVYLQGKAQTALRRSNGAHRVQIRLMGEKSELQAMVSEFAVVVDLLGLDVVKVSPVKALREGGTWGKVYITAEVR